MGNFLIKILFAEEETSDTHKKDREFVQDDQSVFYDAISREWYMNDIKNEQYNEPYNDDTLENVNMPYVIRRYPQLRTDIYEDMPNGSLKEYMNNPDARRAYMKHFGEQLMYGKICDNIINVYLKPWVHTSNLFNVVFQVFYDDPENNIGNERGFLMTYMENGGYTLVRDPNFKCLYPPIAALNWNQIDFDKTTMDYMYCVKYREVYFMVNAGITEDEIIRRFWLTVFCAMYNCYWWKITCDGFNFIKCEQI